MSKLWINLRREIQKEQPGAESISGETYFAVLLQNGKYNPPHIAHLRAIENAKESLESELQELSVPNAASKTKFVPKKVRVRVVGGFMSPAHDAVVQKTRKRWRQALAMTAPLRRTAVQEMVRDNSVVAIGRWESRGDTSNEDLDVALTKPTLSRQ